MDNEKKISRKQFCKVGLLGLLGGVLLMKGMPLTAEATVKDNLDSGGGGLSVGVSAPADKTLLWIDTSAGGRGVTKYWDGSKWSQTASVWDE